MRGDKTIKLWGSFCTAYRLGAKGWLKLDSFGSPKVYKQKATSQNCSRNSMINTAPMAWQNKSKAVTACRRILFYRNAGNELTILLKYVKKKKNTIVFIKVYILKAFRNCGVQILCVWISHQKGRAWSKLISFPSFLGAWLENPSSFSWPSKGVLTFTTFTTNQS